MNPADIRQTQAHEHAVTVSKLKKGDDPLTIGGAEQFNMPEPTTKVSGSPYTTQEISGSIDEMASKMAIGDTFYQGPSPQMGRPGAVLQKSMDCPGCGKSYPAMYTACPHCGNGQVGHRLIPGTPMLGEQRISKSNYDPLLKPVKKEADLYIPGPSEIPTK